MNNEAALLAAAEADRESDVGSPSVWALGDYHAFAKATTWALGAVLARACGISAGQRVLDVAAGTGNTAIRAAEAGADVVACDLTPENGEITVASSGSFSMRSSQPPAAMGRLGERAPRPARWPWFGRLLAGHPDYMGDDEGLPGRPAAVWPRGVRARGRQAGRVR